MSLRRYAPEIGGCNIGHDSSFGSTFDPHIHVTVIHTTSEGTLSALSLAGDLSKNLGARIGLVAIQLVPFRLAIEEPMVSTNFLHQRQALLVAKAGINEDQVSIHICLSRDQKQALAQFLSPRSLIVIGGRRRWWRPERKLEKWLLGMDHHVLFAEFGKQPAPSLLKRLTSTFRRPLHVSN
jgi:hypothetical protein